MLLVAAKTDGTPVMTPGVSTQEPLSFGAYIHIPFCRTRCPYCDFVSHAIPGAVPQEFIKALRSEILAFDGPTRLTSIFIGGGTPSLLAPGDLNNIFDTLAAVFDFNAAEITLEANADDVTVALAQTWRGCGVNRISLGAQSFNNATLRYLGRRHRAAKARHAATIIANNFDNWNIDLIFGAPPATAWTTTLETAIEFHPNHIAAYSLTYEPATLFGGRPPAFDDDAMLDLYERAAIVLTDYDHYEISNFARPGFQCRHNLLYWRNLDYAGFGPGAYSYLAGRRMRNTPNLKDYLQRPGYKAQIDVLSRREQQMETLIQHFRLRDGIAEAYYRRRFGENIDDAFAAPLRALQKRGLIQRDDGVYRDGVYRDCPKRPTARRDCPCIRRPCIRPTWQGFCLNNEIGLALVDAPETTGTSPGE